MTDSDVLRRAASLGIAHLESIERRHVGGQASRPALIAALGGPLPEGPTEPVAVIDALVRDADAGIVSTPGPRYFGFVTGGALPVTVAADWVASAWDQNGALYVMSPAVSALEDIVSSWILS